MTAATRHRETSAAFLLQAEAELEGGQLLQAPEKAWGVVAHYVNRWLIRLVWRQGGC